jgi:metal-responsive CopG/Arc/MetJ family transcriptional regulator
MYKGVIMQRTQIYFEENMLEEIKSRAKSMGISLSAYIRQVLQKDLDEKKRVPEKLDFSEFSGMWKDSDISLDSIREKAWK